MEKKRPITFATKARHTFIHWGLLSSIPA